MKIKRTLLITALALSVVLATLIGFTHSCTQDIDENLVPLTSGNLTDTNVEMGDAGWVVSQHDVATGISLMLWEEHGGFWADAEKRPYPIVEDNNLCWAATVCNMLEWSGWGFVDGMDNTDDFFQYFQDHVTDGGGYVGNGIEWWFTGILPPQTSVEDVDVDGFWAPEYDYNTYSLIRGETGRNASVLPDIENFLLSGYAVGLNINSISGGGAHAINCWGINYDPSVDPLTNPNEYYLGVWVTDSDSHGNVMNAANWLIYFEVEYDHDKGWWYMPHYGAGWRIEMANALMPFPGESRPVADLGGPYVANEGDIVLFNAAGSTDDDPLQYRFDFDADGEWDRSWSSFSNAKNRWYDDYSGDVYLEVFDGRLRDMDTTTVTVNNVAPTIAVTGGTWSHQTIDRNAYVQSDTSLAVDSNNKVHITYTDSDNGNLKYATNAGGSWSYQTIGHHAWLPSIAIDSNDKVHISYCDYTNNDLKYATNAGGTWDHQIVEVSGLYSFSSIAIDSKDKVHISYTGSGWAGPLKYATNSGGSWDVQTIDGKGRWETSIAIDSNDKVHICYSTNVSFRHATNAGGSWSNHFVDSSGSSESIAIDSHDKVHISYVGDSGLEYATNAGGSWNTQTLDSSGDIGPTTSIAIDSNDKVHISYYDITHWDLEYATNAGGGWSYQTPDGYYSVGVGSSIAIDSNDRIHVSYVALTNFNSVNDLKYTTFVGDSIAENGVATVSGTITDPGTEDTFYLTIDWGDGQTSAYWYDKGTTTFSQSHQYLDDDPSGTPSDDYLVSLYIIDDDGGRSSTKTTVIVNNIAPVITATGDSINENGMATINCTITDPGTEDTFYLTIEWGDGYNETYLYPPGTTGLSIAHRYLDDPSGTSSDDYTVTLYIWDDDGGRSSTTTTVTVNNVA
ncbi:MAG: hypothetical protein GKC03_05535, partial [Methanomassiliicoccales archaeon]|nr:hypothetical protein [Methanomassiliicoccales archaeon]